MIYQLYYADKIINTKIGLLQSIGLSKGDILSGLYKNVNILKIEEITKIELLKISHRYIYGSLSSRLINLFNLSHHHYDTRTRNHLRTALHTTDKYNRSFLGKSPQLWLHLTEAIKDIRKIKQFSKKYNLHVIETY